MHTRLTFSSGTWRSTRARCPSPRLWRKTLVTTTAKKLRAAPTRTAEQGRLGLLSDGSGQSQGATATGAHLSSVRVSCVSRTGASTARGRVKDDAHRAALRARIRGEVCSNGRVPLGGGGPPGPPCVGGWCRNLFKRCTKGGGRSKAPPHRATSVQVKNGKGRQSDDSSP